MPKKTRVQIPKWTITYGTPLGNRYITIAADSYLWAKRRGVQHDYGRYGWYYVDCQPANQVARDLMAKVAGSGLCTSAREGAPPLPAPTTV